MNAYISKYSKEYEDAIEHLKNELASINTGRANPSVVENILVESYGVKTPLKQLASISVPEARCLIIQPWDKSIVKDTERAIIDANIGLNPVNEGGALRITVPQLTEEDRIKLTKNVSQKIEQARIRMRMIRDEIKDEIIEAEKDKVISEDEKFSFLEELDDYTKKMNERIKEIGEKKENELMTI